VNLEVRYAPTGSNFASAAAPVALPARPAAPDGLGVELVNASVPADGIRIKNLSYGRAYQYRKSNVSEWNAPFTADGTGVIQLTFGEGHPDYDIRYAATSTSPASFFITVSSPLNVESINFGSLVYGEQPASKPIPIHNITTSDVAIEAGAVTITGAGVGIFTLNAPGVQTAPAGGVNTNWTITPALGLDAGNYQAEVNVNYSVEGKPPYTAKSNVYLVIGKTTWDMGATTADVTGISENGFTVTVNNAPTGAELEYSLAGGEWEAGGLTKAYTGLNAEKPYSVRVRAKEDTNHYRSSDNNTVATVHTAYAAPVIEDVLHIDYGNETLSFVSGYDPANYTVTAEGEPIANYGSLSTLAQNGNIALSLVRKSDGVYPESATTTATVTGKAAAPSPGDITLTKATGDTSSDGKIEYAGTFQYRASRGGANVTQGWQTATDSANVTAGRYEVRVAPTGNAFASKITNVTVG
jgi:hypothetical protein